MENYINSQNQFQPSMGNAGRIFNYNGNNVTMRMQNGTVYVNLTEFAKPFPDKNLSTIINSKEINEYCESLSKLKNFSLKGVCFIIALCESGWDVKKAIKQIKGESKPAA